MCGVIVVDAESFRSTCRGRVPIYMTIPRYSHNYAQFYELLDSNLFTHRNTYAILREASSEPMAPESISLQSNFICIFIFCIYITKYQKYIYLIILSLSDLTFASGREGIDNPFIALVVSSYLFV